MGPGSLPAGGPCSGCPPSAGARSGPATRPTGYRGGCFLISLFVARVLNAAASATAAPQSSLRLFFRAGFRYRREEWSL